MLGSLLLALVVAQADHSERHTDSPVIDGHRAAAPIPPRYHVRNEGGSDGAGLCVIASMTAAGAYQDVADFRTPNADGEIGKGSRLWKAAKSRPGGYYPEKLNALVREQYPDLAKRYGWYYGNDTEVMTKLAKLGIPFGVTMGTGENYGWKPIAHMVTGIDHGAGIGAIVDNNFPGQFTWMTEAEMDRRAKDRSGNFWVAFWGRDDDGSEPTPGASPDWAGAVLVVGLIGAAVVAGWRRGSVFDA